MTQNRNSVRVNLTIPVEIDDWYGQYAALTGQSKSQAIASFLVWTLPEIRYWVRNYHREPRVGPIPLPASPEEATRARQQDEIDHRASQAHSDANHENMSRAERRRKEKEDLKLRRKGLL